MRLIRHLPSTLLLVLLLFSCAQRAITVEINSGDLELEIYEVTTVSVIVSGTTRTGVSWETSDPSIAKVDNRGRIFALAEGTASIEVTSVADPNVTASIDVTVITSNDSRDTATAITLDYAGPSLGINPNDVDYFSFTLTDDLAITADVDADEIGSFLDAVLGLFDEEGDLISLSDDVDGVDPFIVRTLSAGTYYLAVTGRNDFDFIGKHNQRGRYQLDVSVFTGPQGLIEPGFVNIQVEAGGTAQATFTLSNIGGSDLDYSILDGPPGFTPAASTFTEAALDAWSSRARLRPATKPEFLTTDLERLQLETIITDPLGDAFAPPDVVAVEAELTATDVTLRLVMAPGTFTPSNFGGWFDLDLDQLPFTGFPPPCEDQTLGSEAFLDFFDIPFSGNAILYDSNFDFLGEFPVVLDSQDSFTVTIPLSDLGDDGNLDLAGLIGNQSEPTDCVPDTGNGTIGEPGEDPIDFKPTSGSLMPGESVEVTVTVDATELPALVFPWQVLVTTNSILTPELRADLTVEIVSAPDPFEPNDTPGEASVIDLDFSSPELGLIPGDVDWFAFTLTETLLVTADICAEDCGFFDIDTVMGLFDDTLTEIASNDDFTSFDSFIAKTLDAGTYFLAVSGYPDTGFIGDHPSDGPYFLDVTVGPPPPPPPPPDPNTFNVHVSFFGPAPASSQQQIFTDAANYWGSQAITDDIPDFTAAADIDCGAGDPGITSGTTVDDLLIQATITAIDGPDGILGVAGWCFRRTGSFPFYGVMFFDSADVAALEAEGSFDEVILHEMGHVLGIGTLWEELGLLDFAGDNSACSDVFVFSTPPEFTGTDAVAEFQNNLGGSGNIPVEDEFGPGTQCSHWDEGIFGNELMTGFLNSGSLNPVSAMTILQLADLGYEVDAGAADPYSIPGCSPFCLRRDDALSAKEGWERLIRPVGEVTADGRLIRYEVGLHKDQR